MSRIFISYSRKDIEIARQLAAELQKAGFDVWWDISGLKGGDDWVRVIPAAIDASQFFIILLSKASVESQWVQKEYLRALNRRMKIIPLLLEACDVPFALANINYIDFTVDNRAVNLNKLLEALEVAPLPFPPPSPALPVWKQKRFLWMSAAALLGIFLLIGIVRACAAPTPPTPTPVFEASLTPTQTASLSPVPTDTPTTTSTASATVTVTRQPSETPTPTGTATPSPTIEKFPRIELCVLPDIASLWVRTGPGRGFEALPTALAGGDCLLFSARNEAGTWYMISPRQPAPRFAEFEYGWVAAIYLDISAPVSLPEATPIPTATRTPLPTFTPTPTVTLTFTPTITFTPTETFTPIPTDTRMPTATDIATEPPPNP